MEESEGLTEEVAEVITQVFFKVANSQKARMGTLIQQLFLFTAASSSPFLAVGEGDAGQDCTRYGIDIFKGFKIDIRVRELIESLFG